MINTRPHPWHCLLLRSYRWAEDSSAILYQQDVGESSPGRQEMQTTSLSAYLGSNDNTATQITATMEILLCHLIVE